MAKVRIGAGAALACLLLGASAQAANPTPADIMKFQPRQAGIVITTPTDAELAACKVELVTGPGKASGWAMKDARGNYVRKFVASGGAQASIDVWSYYLNGEEVYRELDSNNNKKPDQYRWYNAGGSRWGVDVNEDGRIDGWKIISPEEVTQEVLKAIQTKDVARFQALLINEAEVTALQMPAPDANRIKQQVAQSAAKFNQSLSSFSEVTDKSLWIHLDVQAPQCLPTEGTQEIVHYKTSALLFQGAGDKPSWITTGEMVQVGRAWRLVVAPTAGHHPAGTESNGDGIAGGADGLPKEAQQYLTQLQKIDQSAPQPSSAPATVAQYNMDRAAILAKIIEVIPAKDREPWIKQYADCLSTAAASNPNAAKALSKLQEDIAKAAPGSPLAGYITYREMSAEYTAKTASATPNSFSKLQEDWREKLKTFVTTYPTADDAPEAALQVGMVSEFMGKETEAKHWYTQITTNYAKSPVAPKAAGALRRIDLEGKPLELAGQTLAGQSFNIGQLQGKVVIVYYWASWNRQCVGDLDRMTSILKAVGDKVELVTVNLDDSADKAKAALKPDLQGAHLFQPGGLDSPLAAQYGIMVLPNIFIVGKDGKVANRTAQISTLEDDVKKLLDK